MGSRKREEMGAKDVGDEEDRKNAQEARDEIKRLNALMREEVEEVSYKTPTQIRQEEMRRKRLEEKFEKESREGGVKTHKQRVEELNRYLSGHSEHHDMPKIGPG